MSEMIEFKHILCPVDFSDTSARALTYAAAFAAWYEAKLTVLHVATSFEVSPTPIGDDAGTPLRGSREGIIARLRASIEQVGASALNARPLAQEGIATELIVSCGAAMKADLLVLGTHGLGGVRRLILGSVTETVMRTLTCPVLTVPPLAPATAPRPILFRKILCPIDYSPSSLKALEYALALGRQADGRVTVLHALESAEPEGLLEPSVLEWQRLKAQLSGESQQWCEIDMVVASNRASEEIVRRASGSDADLIVMGAQGSRGVQLMLYGSTTHHVVRAASCPVLTVRA